MTRVQTEVTTVVFDLGNVLVGWDPVRALDHLTAEQVQEFLDDVDFPALNRAQDAGRSWAEARAEVKSAHPQHVDTLDRYLDGFARSLTGPVPGSAEVVEDLLAAGVRVLGLTNWSAETFHHAVPAAPVIGRLEGVLVSGEEGVAKPDPAIFHLLAERYALDPARTVFTDDSPRNIEVAAALGYRTVLFTGAEDLRARLVAAGVLAG